MAKANDFSESMLLKLKSQAIPWDNNENSQDLLDETPITLDIVSNNDEKKPKFQVYIRSSLQKNNIFRIPVKNEDSVEKAIVSAYNLLADFLDVIADEIERHQEKEEG